MDVTDPTPRVNAELLPRYMGKKVRLVGKMEGMEGGMARVQAADGGFVMVRPKAGSSYDTAYVEVEGIVESATIVQEVEMCSFGDNFDMSNYNELCKLANSDQQAIFL